MTALQPVRLDPVVEATQYQLQLEHARAMARNPENAKEDALDTEGMSELAQAREDVVKARGRLEAAILDRRVYG